jgi:predicted deacylase
MGVALTPGRRSYGTIPVTSLASGLELRIPIHIVAGAQPGPTLGLLATTHGDEVAPIEIIRRALDAVDPRALRGNLVAMPVANPIALEWGTRNTPTDMLNLNRSFPGNPIGYFSEQLAVVLARYVENLDCLVDYHSGGADCAISYVFATTTGNPYADRVLELSKVYGLGIVYEGPWFGGTISEYAKSVNIPAVIVEAGGGLATEARILDDAVRGVSNLMKRLGMLDGRPVLPREQLLVHRRPPNPRPRFGGLFYPELGLDMLGKVVPGGTVLARIRHPFTFEEIEQITAPCEETLLIMMRAAFSKVHPGDFAYIVADMKTAERLINEG